LSAISRVTHELVAEQYRLLNKELIPELAAQGIRFLARDAWDDELAAWIRRYFNNQVLPVLSPMGLDPAHPFPRILSKSLNFIVSLTGTDAFGRHIDMAVVQAPRSLPRLIPIPAKYAKGAHNFVFLSSIIHAHVGDLFPGMEVGGCYQFRVTRNGDLELEDEVEDLLLAVEGELPERRFGSAVRLEVADNCPRNLYNFLLQKFELGEDDLYAVSGPVNLARVQTVHELVDRPDLKYPTFAPRARIRAGSDIFEVIRRGDVLLHHPFDSFSTVVELLRQAAADPDVLAIKQTLYRTSPESTIVDALAGAARGGKEVTVIIELRARFDEENNIQLANRLSEAGAQVAYGVVGHKTHAKMSLVVRREGRGKLRGYVHLGTGNYHERTARSYTDIGLITCDEDIAGDVQKLFQQLTGLGKAFKLKRLLQSPFTLRDSLLGFIEREAEHAKAGRSGRIIAKMNSLTEPKIIETLYRASQVGVKIDLVVRGICCLRPGIPDVSENIRVRSVVGRFLEHARVWYFANGESPEVYCSSADWMERNFFLRIESCFPILDPRLAERVVAEALQPYLEDNTQAWMLGSDGKYQRAKPGSAKPRAAQVMLLEGLVDAALPEAPKRRRRA
jgi:polyphosphate kinase